MSRFVALNNRAVLQKDLVHEHRYLDGHRPEILSVAALSLRAFSSRREWGKL